MDKKVSLKVPDYLVKLNPEKLNAILLDSNTLITANPGTGKTMLLAYKYLHLLKSGIDPKDILCLTFTEKACGEMESRILELVKEHKCKVDFEDVNIETFHSFALNNIEENDIISSNLLRFEIYSYLKENKVLNYGDEYLLETIVPKAENAMRYLKSFGLTPNTIDENKVKFLFEDDKKYSKEELETFLKHFIKMFKRYEEAKSKKGLDYADLLINFLKIKNKPKFKWVLVDELQDVNSMEAEIALQCADKYVAVGDKKQAIFGFQGGSISNFSKFKEAKQFVLSENFRSTDQVLDYSKTFFSVKSKDQESINEVSGLKSANKLIGKKPVIIDSKENVPALMASLAQELAKNHDKVAIVARTNHQLFEYAKELESRNIDFSSTFLSSSKEAKQNVILYLQGVLGNDVSQVKAAMFTPFFPISLQDAFELTSKWKLSLEDIYKVSPEFKSVRDSIKSTSDLDKLFRERILPIAFAYGKDYVLACSALQRACIEALDLLDEKTLENFSYFLQTTDLLSEETSAESKIILTSVHKAKGKEYSAVIYIPKKSRDSDNFQDKVVKAILDSKKINAKEELEEESLRIDFVAMTRAKKELIILTDKPLEYISNFSELQPEPQLTEETIDYADLQKRAFALFINKDYSKAKEALENNTAWLKEYVKKHFETLKELSFSGLIIDPDKYFEERILKLKKSSKSLKKGADVHEIIEQVVKGEKVDLENCEPELKAFVENAKILLGEIEKKYPEVVAAELAFEQVPLKELAGIETDLEIRGKIDAIFKNKDQYLIVDWKTDAEDKYGAEHRQQLEVYKKVYAHKAGIPLEKIKIAIGYIGLRKRINDGKVKYEYDDKQPNASAFETTKKRLSAIIDWKNHPEKFFEDLKQTKEQSVLTRSIIQQYKNE